MFRITFNMMLHVTGDLVVGVETGNNELRIRLEKQSEKYAEYHNNLDALLGIRTINEKLPWDKLENYGLILTEANILHIDKSFDWFIVSKVENQNIFKVVGIHKSDTTKNVTYELGEKEGQPFLRILNGKRLLEKSRASSVADIVPVVTAASIIIGIVKEMSKK